MTHIPIKFERRIIDTLNGALNKHLIDNFIVIRRVDGSRLSNDEIMRLTRPYFKSAIPENHWEETPMQKQFSETIRMATESSDEAEAARMFVGTICPMCNSVEEGPDGPVGKGVALYNSDQMVVAFIAGQQWLHDRIARSIPLPNLDIVGAMDLLRRFIYALPKDLSIETAIKYLSEQKIKED